MLEAKKLQAALKMNIEGAKLGKLQEKLSGLQTKPDEEKGGFNFKAVQKAFVGLGAAIAGSAITAAVTSFVEDQVGLALALEQTAKILGVTTTELQQLHVAAQESNTDVNALDSALRFLNRTIGSEGGKGIGAKGAKELEHLGISLKGADGKSRAATDVFADLADKLAATGDQAKATEIAMQVLGRGGARVLPMLMQGGEKLREKFAELAKYGGGISPDMVEKSRELQVEQTRLGIVWESLTSTLAAGFIPSLIKSVTWLTKMGKSFLDLAKTTTFFNTFLLFVSAAGISLGIFGIVKAVLALGAALKMSLPELGLITAGLLALYVIFDDLYEWATGNKSTSIGAAIDAIWGEGHSDKALKALKKDWDDIGLAIKVSGGFLEAMWKTVLDLGSAFSDLNSFMENPRGNHWADLKADLVKLKKDQHFTGALDDELEKDNANAKEERNKRDFNFSNPEEPGYRSPYPMRDPGLGLPSPPRPGGTGFLGLPPPPPPPITLTQHFHGQHDPKKVEAATKAGLTAALQQHSAEMNRDAYAAAGAQ